MQTTLFLQSLRSLRCSTTLNASASSITNPALRSSSHFSVTISGRTAGFRFKSTKAAAKSASTPKPVPSAASGSSSAASASELGAANAAKKSAQETLSWPQYLTIRRSKRRWQNLAAFPSSILGLLGGAAYFGGLDTDPLKPIFGVDPFMFYGFCTVACMGGGYLIGPTLGAFIWRRLPSTRKYGSVIDKKDKEFYERIAKNRVDVTLQSPTSPVPDYYGEKIGSLHEYRKWLRDQNKYRRKVVFEESA
ncbi:hypothetical protein GYMLUDRAFT_41714 [Collybiopsis luxurians FD-317 M1]|uniref:Presequence translocated-associated motor subunit PAM17 n=1 Tax=Collybiopsis luxurians FD-317 M1 TaxID=944289 RepID=A0A0D0D173_9AGAR|nr:hypothetical protein GYMLUDRAFT_41714 [Collybiopsis luxurians FD-317 M1]